jgi:hypothetical protein
MMKDCAAFMTDGGLEDGGKQGFLVSDVRDILSAEE